MKQLLLLSIFRIGLLSLSVLMFSVQLSAQQSIPFNHFSQSNMLWNPGEAGVGGGTNVFFQYRNQWTGFDGAPKNLAIGVDHYIGKRVGLGMSLYNEQIGPLSNLFGTLNYAYHLPFEDGTLSFGINASFINYNGNFTALQTIEEGDAVFFENLHIVRPNFGTGVVYYNDKVKFGVSVPRLLENKEDQYNISKGNLLERTFYAFGLYEINIGDDFAITPSAMLLYDIYNGNVMGLDTKILYKNTFGINLGINTLGWLNGGINIAFNETFEILYSYSVNNQVNQAYFAGSHEFTLVYRRKNKL